MALDNYDRELELEEHLDIDITELLARAADAGYSEEEATVAILNVAKFQSYVHGWQPEAKTILNSRVPYRTRRLPTR